MTIRPNFAFRYIRPDEVAECWEGVGPDLCSALWGLVELYREKEGEWPEPGVNALSKYWRHLTAVQQRELNALAAARDTVNSGGLL